MSKIDIAPSPEAPSERVEFVEHDYGGWVFVTVTFPGSTPRELDELDLYRDDWEIMRRVLSKPSVTFVRYSRQAGACDVA